MINLKSSNKHILDELNREQHKATYWLIKKFGGEISYEKMRDKLLAAATSLKKDVFTEGVEYNSPNGNRWMVYECAHYYPEAKAANTQTFAFCFYKTVGCIGAFVPVRISGSNEQSALIFTSHFFQRFEERLGIKYDSPEMLLRFHQIVSKMVLQYNKKENDIQIRMPDAIGLGVKREGEGFVFEIRTILSDNQLSNGQFRKTESIRETAEKLNHEPLAITKIRLKNKNMEIDDLVVEMDRMAEHYQALGEKPESVRSRMEVYMWIGYIFHNLGYINEDENEEQFLKRFGKVNNDLLIDYARNEERSVDSFIDLCTNCIREMNLKGFDRNKAKQILLESGAISIDGTLLSPTMIYESESA